MKTHSNAFLSLIISIIISILIILIFWQKHKVTSIITIILILLILISIGEYFDREKLRKMKHLIDLG